MKDIDLEELERLAKEASLLPWSLGDKPCLDWIFSEDETGSFVVAWTSAPKELSNAEYIVAACNAVPELIKRVRELERERDWLAKKCEDLSEDPEDLFMPYGIPAKEWIERAEKAAILPTCGTN